MQRLVLPALTLALASGCAMSTPPAEESPASLESTRAQAETTVVHFSDALAAGDSAGLAALVTPDFVLQEDGVTYDFASSFASIRDALRLGSVSRHVTQFRTRVSNDVAWTQYHVEGVLQTGGHRVLFERLETAVLVRSGGNWRVTSSTSMTAASAK